MLAMNCVNLYFAANYCINKAYINIRIYIIAVSFKLARSFYAYSDKKICAPSRASISTCARYLPVPK